MLARSYITSRDKVKDKSYYVYALFDWKGIPRYIGKGKRGRWNWHETRSDPSNWLKNEIIEQTWLMLGEIPKIKIAEHLSNLEAIQIEIAFIKAIGRFPYGPLVNMTKGGDGVPGSVHSILARQAISLAQKGVAETPEAREALKRAAQNPMRRAKISAALTGRKQSPEHREKNRQKSLGRKHSEETKRKMSESHSGEKHHMYGKKHYTKSKAKMSATKMGRVPWNKGKSKKLIRIYL